MDTQDDDVARELLGLGAATVGESGGRPLDPAIHAVWPGARVAGPAFAVRCTAGDNLAVHAAVAVAPPGSVLCVGFDAPDPRGYWGEVLTTGAQARGITALVIDGDVRDVDALERLGFPVFARGLVLRGASKVAAGTIGGSVVVGGVEVHTGDWLVGDRDGVAAVAARDLDGTRSAGAARAAAEVRMFDALRAGATTVELLGLDTGPVAGA